MTLIFVTKKKENKKTMIWRVVCHRHNFLNDHIPVQKIGWVNTGELGHYRALPLSCVVCGSVCLFITFAGSGGRYTPVGKNSGCWRFETYPFDSSQVGIHTHVLAQCIEGKSSFWVSCSRFYCSRTLTRKWCVYVRCPRYVLCPKGTKTTLLLLVKL